MTSIESPLIDLELGLAMDSTAQDRKLLLIIEDNELCGKLVTDTLRVIHPSLNIHLCRTALEGLEFAKAHQPDAIHVDCLLPGGHSGIEFLAWCGAIPRLAAAPKMMVTCIFIPWGDPDLYWDVRREDPEVVAMLEGGAIESLPIPRKYFRKPIVVAHYIEAVGELLGLRGPSPHGEIVLATHRHSMT